MANRKSRQNPSHPINPFITIPNFEDQTYNVHSSNIYEQEVIPPPVAGAAATISSPTSGRHPMYRGIRSRSGKWVSEIREPRKTTRIWLGTYATPEMAAAAYDVAALALKGPDATINFPGLVDSYPIPASHSANDIRAAAASAASARAVELQVGSGQYHIGAPQQGNEASSSVENKFVDEEELFEMPKLLVDMAEGMLLSPPRMKTAADDDDSPENYSKNDSLWSYP